MNRRFVLAFLLIICGCMSFLILHENENTPMELVFTKEAGFYEEPFFLELLAPVGTSIYYTLDGSVPDENAALYTEPILIDDATGHENVHCMRTDVVWRSFTHSDIMDNGSIDPVYKVPDYLIDKCTVIRAAYKDADGNFSAVKTASYFIGFNCKSGYDGVNILSVSTDPQNLFDYETGIYVFPFGLRNTANYMESGIAWERDASIQIFDSQRELILNQDCGIRIQGGVNRERLPKGLNLYAREQYSGSGRFYFDLFDTEYIADAITLFASGEDAMSKCRDVLASRLTAGRNFAVMHYKPYVMFLDGEYWGFYWLTEKYNDVYFEHYYDVDDDNVVMIKAFTLAEGEENDFMLYTDMMEYISNTDMSIPENYARACEMIDIQSFIDYYAVQIYLGHNRDWPYYNEGLWRVRQPGEGKYEDGKWRWFLYDVNCALVHPDWDTLSTTINTSKMFSSLCQNEDFKSQFVTTFMDIANINFAKDNVDIAISNCVDQMESPMETHLKRFFAFKNNERYLKEVEYIEDFFDSRRNYITQYLKDNFELTGTLAPITIKISDAAAGNIFINTAEIDFDTNCRWNGEYYTDYPISLTAIANDGYQFLGWRNEDGSQNESESIDVVLANTGCCVKAIFEEKSLESK